MSVYDITMAAVQAGAPGTTQLLAVRMATNALDGADPALAERALADLRRLAGMPLVEAAASELRNHPNEKVRADAWAAPGVSRGDFLAHIAVERSPRVRAGMFASPHAQDAEVADLLCTPMGVLVAKAATAGTSKVSPAVRVAATRALAASFEKLRKEQRSAVCNGILTLPVSPVDIMVDHTMPLELRVAAAGNRLVPIADLDGKLPELLDQVRATFPFATRSRRDEWFGRLESCLHAVAGRDDLTDGIVDAVALLRITHSRLVAPTGEWTKWLDPQAWAERFHPAPATSEVSPVRAAVFGCSSTEELTAFWDRLNPVEQDEARTDVVLHQQCDVALFTRVTAGVDTSQEWHSLAGGQVWCFESHDVWLQVIAQNVNTAWRWVDTDRAPAHLRSQVFDWFVDELLNPTLLPHGRWATDGALWREVTDDPRFPRDRFDEIDDAIVLSLLEAGQGWVRKAVFDRLEALPADRLDSALMILPTLQDSGMVFGELLTATATALAD